MSMLAGMLGGIGSGIAETANLAVVLRLKDEMTGPLGHAERSMASFHAKEATVSGGLGKIGAGAAHAAKMVAGAGIAIGAAVGLVALDSFKAAAKFQQDMELIRTQAGSTQTEVDNMTKAVLAMAPAVGMGPDELAKGLYHIESAGLRGAKALDVLKAAAQGAQTGNADLESVTNALIAAVYSGIKGVDNMSAAMGQLDAIVGSGNMRMQDLASSLSSGILPSGRAFGLALKDVGAALATMTDQGVPAQEAATRLRMSFSLLGAPTAKAAGELKGIGMTELQLARDMRKPDGLLVALTDLYDHLKAAGDIMANGQLNAQGTDLISKAFGGGRSSSTILTLLQSLDKLKSKYDIIGQGATTFGDKWQATTETAAYNAKAFGANIDELKTILGVELLPTATRVLGQINKYLASEGAQKGAKNLGDAIAGIFSQSNIDKGMAVAHDVFGYIQGLPWDAIKTGIMGAAQGAKAVVDVFKSLPPGVQEGLITLLAANKLTGGLVASGLGDLLKVGLMSLKTITAGSVTVIGGSVTGGGVPGVTPSGTPVGPTSILGVALKGIGMVAIVGTVADALVTGTAAISDQLNRNNGKTDDQIRIMGEIATLEQTLSHDTNKASADLIRAKIADLQAQLGTGPTPISNPSLSGIAAAIDGSLPKLVGAAGNTIAALHPIASASQLAARHLEQIKHDTNADTQYLKDHKGLLTHISHSSDQTQHQSGRTAAFTDKLVGIEQNRKMHVTTNVRVTATTTLSVAAVTRSHQTMIINHGVILS